jgi:hypothetical protein
MKIAAFILELIQRIGAKSPKFFKVIRWTAGVLAAAAGAATALIDKGMWNPAGAATIQSIVSAAWPVLTAIWGMSHLPVDDSPSALKQTVNPSNN